MSPLDRLGWLAAVAHGPLPPVAYRVAIALAVRAGQDGSCWPAESTLAADLGLLSNRLPDDRAVRRGVEALRKAGMVRVAPAPDKATRADRVTNRYTLTGGRPCPTVAAHDRAGLAATIGQDWQNDRAGLPSKQGIEQGREQGRGLPAASLPGRFQADHAFRTRWPELRAKAAAAFPGVDLEAELLRADGWLTASGIVRKSLGRFAWNWFNRAATPHPSQSTPTGDGLTRAQRDELEARQTAAVATFEKAIAPGGILSEATT